MNKTEEAYAERLEARKALGEVLAWYFEPVKFKLADSACGYTPDFMVLLANGSIEFVDAKGGGPMDDKSRVKVKVAADRYWWFQFVIEQRQSKSKGGGWKREEF